MQSSVGGPWGLIGYPGTPRRAKEAGMPLTGPCLRPAVTSEIRVFRDGLHCRLFCRIGCIAIYEVVGHGWEVIKIRIVAASEIWGKDIPSHERYPSVQEFGKHASYLKVHECYTPLETKRSAKL